jgi:polyvinyl alcohol dehydrogenase (cytochrome)
MSDAGLRISDGRWRAHATKWGLGDPAAPGAETVPRGNALEIEWSKRDPKVGKTRRQQLRTWGQYGEPLFVQTPPYDESGPHQPGMVKFTPASAVPVEGAPDSPLTSPPDPRIGTTSVRLAGKTSGGTRFAKLIGRGRHRVAGTSAFTRGFAFITVDNLSNNQAAEPPQRRQARAKTARCAAPAPGGEWRTFGRSLANTRAQPKESAIDASNVGSLAPDFIFDTGDHASGTVHSTPIVADGCVYFGTAAAPPRGEPAAESAADTGRVFALNAETGEPVWKTKLDVGKPGLLCTGIIGSTPVANGRVFAIVSQSGNPYAVALDQRTGKVLWKRVLDRTPQVYNCGGPVVFKGIVLAPFTGDQTGPTNRGGYALLDAKTGKRLARSYTIPKRDFRDGYKGGGIWTTPAVDKKSGYAYFGTANPDAGTPEHARTNSIIKVDVKRKRGTFGKIVDSYKGNPDRYAEAFPAAPLPCDPDHRLSPYIRSVLCAQMDLDFGASPNLITRPNGEKWVTAMQKSGVFHVVDARTMERVRTTVLGPPVFYGNGSTAATDGSSMFVAASPPGQMFGLDLDSGNPRWTMPLADAIHYQAVTYANGLVYANDAKGYLNVFRADNGALVGHRWIGGDIGQPNYAEESSGSTALARNTVYVAASNFVVAYRPAEQGGG